MSDVEFNEDVIAPLDMNSIKQSTPRRGGMAGMLMRYGLAKDEKQARTILMSLSILLFVLSVFFFGRWALQSTRPQVGTGFPKIIKLNPTSKN